MQSGNGSDFLPRSKGRIAGGSSQPTGALIAVGTDDGPGWSELRTSGWGDSVRGV